MVSAIADPLSAKGVPLPGSLELDSVSLVFRMIYKAEGWVATGSGRRLRRYVTRFGLGDTVPVIDVGMIGNRISLNVRTQSRLANRPVIRPSN